MTAGGFRGLPGAARDGSGSACITKLTYLVLMLLVCAPFMYGGSGFDSALFRPNPDKPEKNSEPPRREDTK